MREEERYSYLCLLFCENFGIPKHFKEISIKNIKIHLEKLCYDSIPPYQIQTKRGYIIEFHGGNNNVVKVSQLCMLVFMFSESFGK